MPLSSKKKKKFIDKKTAITFTLVHRSQHDPLTADEKAPQRVLVERDGGTTKNDRPSTGDGARREKTDLEKRKEEEQKYGVYFDDEYDYLQHLKDVRQVGSLELVEATGDDRQDTKIQLPSSVFASEVEEEIGLLNRAAPIRGPRPELDPDIVAALDSDGENADSSDSELEDDFILKANASPTDDEEEEAMESDDEDGEETDEEWRFCSGRVDRITEELEEEEEDDEHEVRSRFTDYSLSSSVIRRNQGLTLLDDRFEKIIEEYDEDQIGALEGEEEQIDGFLKPGDELLESVIQDFKKGQLQLRLADLENGTRDEKSDGSEEEEEEEKDHEELVKVVLEEDPTGKWDCESILSTYSTLYNHPAIISEPPSMPKRLKISSRTGLPQDVLRSGSGLTRSALKALENEDAISGGEEGDHRCESTTSSVLSRGRAKTETPDERRIRKKAVKEQRKERRMEKKANTLAFKEEKKRQTKVMLNLQQNLQGIKIS